MMKGGYRQDRLVTVRLGSDLAALSGATSDRERSLLSHLSLMIDELLADLSIPRDYRPVVEECPELGTSEFHITVEERECRVSRDFDSALLKTVEDLSGRLADVLYANRQMFLWPGLSSDCWRQWTGAEVPCPSNFGQLMGMLVRRGLRIDRLKEPISTLAEETLEVAAMIEDNSGPDLFEQILASLNGPRVRILASPACCEFLLETPDATDNPSGERQPFEKVLRSMGDELFYELGIVYRIDGVDPDASLADCELRFQFNDLRMPPVKGIRCGELLVEETPDRLNELGLAGHAAINPVSGVECSVVRYGEDARKRCVASGLAIHGPEDIIVKLAMDVIRRNAGALLTTNVTRFLLGERMPEAFPILVERVRDKYDDNLLTKVLRNLLDEGISIRDLRSILECLASFQGKVPLDICQYIIFPVSPGAVLPVNESALDFKSKELGLTECVRKSLHYYISHKYTRGQTSLLVYLLDPEVEQRLVDARPLSEIERDKLLDAMDSELARLPSQGRPPVILTTQGARARLSRETSLEYPHLTVLSYQELRPELNIQPIARLSW